MDKQPDEDAGENAELYCFVEDAELMRALADFLVRLRAISDLPNGKGSDRYKYLGGVMAVIKSSGTCGHGLTSDVFSMILLQTY